MPVVLPFDFPRNYFESWTRISLGTEFVSCGVLGHCEDQYMGIQLSRNSQSALLIPKSGILVLRYE